MNTKTISTPRIVNLCFLAFLVIMMIPFFAYIASAKTISFNYCDKIYYDSYVGQVFPEYEKMCRNRWTLLTNRVKRSYINNYNKYDSQK